MHLLQPKHSKVSPKEAKEILQKFNVSSTQLPRIKITDPALPEGCKLGDLIKIETKSEEGKTLYYRVVVE